MQIRVIFALETEAQGNSEMAHSVRVDLFPFVPINLHGGIEVLESDWLSARSF